VSVSEGRGSEGRSLRRRSLPLTENVEAEEDCQRGKKKDQTSIDRIGVVAKKESLDTHRSLWLSSETKKSTISLAQKGRDDVMNENQQRNGSPNLVRKSGWFLRFERVRSRWRGNKLLARKRRSKQRRRDR